MKGGHLVDYVGAVRVVSIAGKLMFERLTKLDSHDMVMYVSTRAAPIANRVYDFLYALQITTVSTSQCAGWLYAET